MPEHELWMLSKYAEEAREISAAISAWVEKARNAGASWAEIGHALGMTKQGAQQRYGKDY